MPVRVHAILVVRPDGRTPAAYHLRRTLAAVRLLTPAPEHLTIVLCGDESLAAEAVSEAGVEVIPAPASTRYAAAVGRVTVHPDAEAVWLLAQDTVPDTMALARLAGALERAPSAALAAPKLVRAEDRSTLVSMGVSVTRLGRTVGLADGELDQGQHDGTDDVLGADVRGILVRRDAWRELDGLDPALAGADEGLDLSIRARLAGGRIVVVPGAVVAVAGDGVAGPPSPTTAPRRRHAVFAARVAQLHRRLAYAPVWAAPLHWLSILPLAVWRTALALLRKQPAVIAPEWAAALVALVRPLAVVRSRRRIHSARRVPWSQLRALRVTRRDLRARLEDEPYSPDVQPRSELRFFAGGGAWLVLGAVVVAVVALPALLAWPVLGGGGLQPLRANAAQLWGDTAFGERALSLATVGPADPFAVVIALVGSLWPGDPSRAVVVLWVLALPLAALGGWFAATRVTERAGLRIAVGIVWALGPAFLAALMEGRPAALLTHLLLPWLFFAGSVAHRSWSAAGAASLLLAGVIACAPSLAPALLVVWAGAILLAAVLRAGRGVVRLVWIVVPTLALAGPLVWRAFDRGDGWWLLADPGPPWAGAQVGSDLIGRALLAAGIPTPDIAGWATFIDLPVWWVPLLVAPMVLLALVAPLTQRWAVGAALLVVAVLGVGTAFAAVALTVFFTQSVGVPLWPGPGLSLAWLGLIGGAAVALDAGLAPRSAAIRPVAAALLVLAIAVLAVPQLTALVRGVSPLQNGPQSTLPAYVAAEGTGNVDVGTLVLTPQNSGGASARVVWGASETVGAQTTIVSTRTSPTPADAEVAALAADLMTGAAADAVGELAGNGIAFVLLAPAASPESDAARTLRFAAGSAIDQRDGLDAVGETAKGALWRVTVPLGPRAAPDAGEAAAARLIAGTQIAVAAIALLLAVPTAASRRQAQRTSRLVGPHWREIR